MTDEAEVSVLVTEGQKPKLVRWPNILGGSIVFLMLGVLYAWSLFAGPLETEYGWTRSETSLVFTISMCFFAVGNLIGGFMVQKMSIRLMVRISALLLLIGFVGSSYVTAVWQLYITYGVLAGFAVGFSYAPTVSTIVAWYPDKTGTASGMVLLAFGLSTLLVGTPIASLFRLIGVSRTFLAVGIGFAVCLALAAQLLKAPPKDAVLPKPKPKAKKASLGFEVRDMKTSEVVRRPSFWLYVAWQMGLSTAGFAVIGHAATSAVSIGATLVLATAAASGFSIANGFSRLLWGIITDAVGIALTRLFISITMMAGFALSIGAFAMASPTLLVGAFVVTGCAYGGVPSYGPSYIRGMYGPTHYASNYSIGFLPGIPNAFIGPTIMAAVYTATGSYLPAFAAVAVCVLAGAFAALFIRKP